MLDLCCGLKGASNPFKILGWDVITLDINPDFNPDIVADVSQWHNTDSRALLQAYEPSEGYYLGLEGK